jgi:NAD(P)-dependent dehydrogenase (short-subunit alcohol dehydrogenase family)
MKVLVTGANRGIGLELCRAYAERGDEVIAVCRRKGGELPALDVRIVDGVDVADPDGIDRLRTALDGQRIDILVNCAGILRRDRLESLDYQAMLDQYRVNALGPLRVTQALLDNLGRGAKVVIVSSRVGSLEDNGSGNNYGYRMSKAAVNMAGVNLMHDLKPRGVSVLLVHPGMVATEMTGGSGIPPRDAARGIVARTDELDLSTSGSFRHAEGYRLPW